MSRIEGPSGMKRREDQHMADWYYLRGGQQQGPIGSAELKQLAATGGLGADDMVWKEGMAEWIKAGTVTGLAFAGAAPAPTPAPTPVPAVPAPFAPAAAGQNPSEIGYYSTS